MRSKTFLRSAAVAAALALAAGAAFAGELNWQSYDAPGYLGTKRKELKTTEFILTSHLEHINSSPHPDDRVVLSCLEKLTAVCTKEQKFKEAQDYCQLAIRFAEKLNDPLKTAQLRNGLANLYLRQDKFTQAELAFSRNRDFACNQPESESAVRRIRAEALFGMADVLSSEGKFTDANALYKQAFALLTNEDGLGTSAVVRYAKCLMESGQLDRAKQELTAVLTADQQSLGDQAPALAATLNNLAIVSVREKDMAQAQQLMERAVAIARKYGYTDLPNWLDNLSDILTLANKDEQAKALRAEAQSMRKQPPQTAAVAQPK